ncbi:DUF4251 domain-containing protein [Flammeovirgaceae bacterium SG7u.111]|nr:DUF4251 domain-containing protein [Flammeovirgaceae bacterium SG7u.132]WPO38241.1 DUF4251 domain-containing protein [Flammeovirgaceae bacterium SG7u.111]
MKKLTLFLVVTLLSSAALLAQENKKLSKKERKALREQKTIENKKLKMDIINSKKFVIEAHTVYGSRGMSYQMSPTTNFVMLNEDKSVIQLSFMGIVGWNGVGGITLEGNTSRWEVIEGKPNQSITVRLRTSGSTGSATMSLTIPAEGTVRAFISGDFGDKITFAGELVPLSESRVFQGQTTY